MINEFLVEAARLVSTPYVWGGNTPAEGLDCSGYVLHCLRKVGLWGTHDDTAHGIYNYAKANWRKSSIDVPGTILFFGKDKVTHVGICLRRGLMLHASGGGSKCRTFTDAAILGASVKIQLINTRKDLRACYTPFEDEY